jgi:hypothetical protein
MPASIPTLLWWKRMGSKLPKFSFNLSQATFVAAMAKRNSAGPFAAGVLAQGKRDNTGTPDSLYFAPGTAIATNFYPKIDVNQGSITFWITPEWAGNDNLLHYFFSDVVLPINLYKTAGNMLLIQIMNRYMSTSIATWTAGTTYCVCARWDAKNTLDGTNYQCISINDTHVFGTTSAATITGTPGNIQIGSIYYGSDALIEGLTVYRRTLWDGAYGVNVGNGDEINLIYAAGAGADPCTITGSWDITLMIPTDSQVGALVTG